MFNLVKRITLSVLTLVIISSLTYSQDDMKTKESTEKADDQPVAITMSDGILYGKDYDPTMTVIEFSDLMNSPNEYSDKVVLVRGNVSEVCQKMGCWMTLSDGTNNTRVKTLHEFFLPKDIAGQKAVVIGTFKITEISEDLAKHYNEETKNPKLKTEDIQGPQKAYEIEPMGIKILNKETDSNKN